MLRSPLIRALTEVTLCLTIALIATSSPAKAESGGATAVLETKIKTEEVQGQFQPTEATECFKFNSGTISLYVSGCQNFKKYSVQVVERSGILGKYKEDTWNPKLENASYSFQMTTQRRDFPITPDLSGMTAHYVANELQELTAKKTELEAKIKRNNIFLDVNRDDHNIDMGLQRIAVNKSLSDDNAELAEVISKLAIVTVQSAEAQASLKHSEEEAIQACLHFRELMRTQAAKAAGHTRCQ